MNSTEQNLKDYSRLMESHIAVLQENARLREALEPFARDAVGIHPDWSDERRRASLTQEKPLTVGDFRKAREALAAAKAVQPQAQASYCERWYGSGDERGWWIVRGGLVKREHVAFLGESVAPEEVSKVVAALNAHHPKASEPGWMPIESAPKDSSRILVYLPTSNRPVQEVWWAIPYEGSTDGWWSTPQGPTGRGYVILPESPTHWQPLPAAPEVTNG